MNTPPPCPWLTGRFRRNLRSARTCLPWTVPLLFFLSSPGCSRDTHDAGPASIVDGVWSMEAGSDEFLWEFERTGSGLACLVHDMVGPVKLNETPCVTAEINDGRVVVTMDTGVRLEGELALEERRMPGRLLYLDGTEREADLHWHARGDYPALEALPDTRRPYAYAPPPELDDGWATGNADAVGVPTESLEELVEAVAEGEAGILHSLLIARDGQLILEEYFHGYRRDDLHHLASVTKSVSSLLVGLAVGEGAIDGVGTPVLDFFPEHRDAAGAGWDGLTLENLLTMSMALDWPPEDADNLHGTGPEFFARVLSRSVSGIPGEDWAYVSANVNLIAGILHEATGEHAEAFAARALFRPLGIETWNWDGLKTRGFNLMDGSLRLLPRDMARIGQLVLDGGRWAGRQVVAEDWINRSTARHIPAGDGPEGYGYLWWMLEQDGPGGAPVPVIFANGWGSQFISIFPTLDLVVVTTGGNEYNGKHMNVARLLGRYLIPAL